MKRTSIYDSLPVLESWYQTTTPGIDCVEEQQQQQQDKKSQTQRRSVTFSTASPSVHYIPHSINDPSPPTPQSSQSRHHGMGITEGIRYEESTLMDDKVRSMKSFAKRWLSRSKISAA